MKGLALPPLGRLLEEGIERQLLGVGRGRVQAALATQR